MNKIAFWSEWDKTDRLTFKVLSIVTLLFIIAALVIELGGLSYFFQWEMTAYLDKVVYPLFSNHSSFIESTIAADVQLLLQKAGAGYQLLPAGVVYAFLGVIIVGVSMMLGVLSYLSRFWYVVSMGAFILLVAGMGVSTIGLLGLSGQLAIGVVVVPVIALTYYFNSFRADLSLGIRVLAILALLLLFGTLIAFTSVESHPVLLLAYNAYWPGLVLTVVFALIVGHEIIYAILILTTQDSKESESGNTLHFIVFSLIYLVNVALLYMKNTGVVDWNIYYLNAFLLLSVSTVLGVWGIKGREVLYGSTLPFRPYALVLYLSMAVISFATIVFVFLSGNDSAVEVLEDAIVFGHIGFGSSFLVYIIANFISLLVKNLPVHRVAFREDNFPYATGRLAGFIVVAALFFASNYAALSQAVSGYLNGLGDMSLMTNDMESAKDYYDRGARYGNLLNLSNKNHKSNLMIGLLEPGAKKSIDYFKNATRRRPTEHAYTSLGLAYEAENMFFDAMFTYQEGLEKFPDSWALNNNIALLFNRTNVLDSTLYYLNKVEGNDWQASLVEANKLAVGAKHRVNMDVEGENTERVSLMSNALAYEVLQKETAAEYKVFNQDATRLNLFTFSYLNNLGLACMRSKNDAYLSVVDQYLDDPNNGDFHSTLAFLKGANLYVSGRLTDAFNHMNMLRGESLEMEAKASMTMGKWAMELGQPFLANKYFELSREAGYPWATADLAQSFAGTNSASVAQYILYQAYTALDSTRYQNEIGQLKQLEQAVANQAVTWKGEVYDFATEQAQLQAIESDKAGKEAYVALAMTNPFYGFGVLSAVDYLNANEDAEAAYEVLQNAVSVNEFSVPIIKSYIDQCFKLGYVNYAESTILRLYEILPQEEYFAYEQEFEVKKTEAEAAAQEW